MYISPYFFYSTSVQERSKNIAFDSAPLVELSKAHFIIGRSETEIALSNLAYGTDVSPQFCSVRVDVLR